MPNTFALWPYTQIVSLIALKSNVRSKTHTGRRANCNEKKIDSVITHRRNIQLKHQNRHEIFHYFSVCFDIWLFVSMFASIFVKRLPNWSIGPTDATCARTNIHNSRFLWHPMRSKCEYHRETVSAHSQQFSVQLLRHTILNWPTTTFDVLEKTNRNHVAKLMSCHSTRYEVSPQECWVGKCVRASGNLVVHKCWVRKKKTGESKRSKIHMWFYLNRKINERMTITMSTTAWEAGRERERVSIRKSRRQMKISSHFIYSISKNTNTQNQNLRK